ncbi:nuclear transport factor 2 family protein [Gordonia mangrovi]|uniref:nuclear transport factor 2 family protein n=1 Tax=Gordonia mangrovi TaxID=2665643 RepID=UPI00136F87B2|nr:nuclear transport factor 2 family protein [Gordonia mangrovi]UVF79377.1 nuclear transport factor 2 family protein [Gordonia mangrovi]
MELSDLRSRAEISDALAALAWAQDRKDWAHVRAAYLPDATYVHPGGRLEGADAIADRTSRALDLLDSSQHLVGSIVIEVCGSHATSLAQFQAVHVREDAVGGELYTIAGSYTDRWTLTEGGWRIAHREQQYYWRTGNREVVVPTDLGDKS